MILDMHKMSFESICDKGKRITKRNNEEKEKLHKIIVMSNGAPSDEYVCVYKYVCLCVCVGGGGGEGLC